MAAIFLSQNNETAAMLVSQTSPRELNSFLMQTLSFVTINLHIYWPREWKHSIVGTTVHTTPQSGTENYPIWDNPLYRSAQRSSTPLQTPFFVWTEALSDMILCRHKSYPGNCRHNPNPNSRFATPTPTPQGGGYRISSHDHESHPLVTEDHRFNHPLVIGGLPGPHQHRNTQYYEQ